MTWTHIANIEEFDNIKYLFNIIDAKDLNKCCKKV